MYILSLGSQQGNAHVLAYRRAADEGPFKQQQFEALRMDAGILSIPDEQMSELAETIRQHLAILGR